MASDEKAARPSEAKRTKLPSERRRRARTACARAIQIAAGATCSHQALAVSLETGRQTVDKWASGELAMPLADVVAAGLAGRREFARMVLVTALTMVEEHAPAPGLTDEMHALQISGAAGHFAALLAKGGTPDRKEVARACAEVFGSVQRALRDLGLNPDEVLGE